MSDCELMPFYEESLALQYGSIETLFCDLQSFTSLSACFFEQMVLNPQ